MSNPEPSKTPPQTLYTQYPKIESHHKKENFHNFSEGETLSWSLLEDNLGMLGEIKK